jgi:lysophospholipase L1-like esterase
MGDSTAAGIGNPLVPNATAEDDVCARSIDAYAAQLAAAGNVRVQNLACSGATIEKGILGSQTARDRVVPPQFGVAQQATDAHTIIVSIGANDVNWAVMVKLCSLAPSCDDDASKAFFQNRLSTFIQNYDALLTQLSNLPNHPRVLINQYYMPFGSNLECLKEHGITAEKAGVMASRAGSLNEVLANGAKAHNFLTVQPRVEGHQLCDASSYIQGLGDKAPLHPTAAGEAAIALADLQALMADRPNN